MRVGIDYGNPSLFTNHKRKKKSKMKFVKALAVLAVVGTAASLTLSSSKTASDKNEVTRRGFVGSVAGVAAATSLAGPAMADGDDPYADFTTTESGLKYKITKEGDGAVPVTGQTVKAHYTGWLDGFDSIKKFDSSRDRGRPFSFKVCPKASIEEFPPPTVVFDWI